MNQLDPKQLDWIGIRFLDRNGRVFRHEGKIYRAIYPERVDHIRDLFQRGVIGRLVEKGLLIGSEISDLEVAGFGMVIRHETLPFSTKPGEWTRSFVRDAALCALDLNLELAREGLSTDDGHGNNIGQRGACRPVWLDLGSINPLSEQANPVYEIRRHFTNPLRVVERLPSGGRLMGEIIRTGGLRNEELEGLLYERWHPRRLVSRAKAELARRTAPKQVTVTSTAPQRVDANARIDCLRRERALLESLDLKTGWTEWASYHPENLLPDDYSRLPEDARRQAILNVIEERNPATVIDLAANAGFFSFYCARRGATVLAADYDENAVERLYAEAKRTAEKLRVTCACFDVTKPPEDVRRAELVTALALVHHLSLGQAFPFDVIAKRLAAYSSNSLLVEFMPNGLGSTVPKPNPLPDWYRLDAFLDALTPLFSNVEVINYDRDPAKSHRVLILATGRYSAPGASSGHSQA